MKKVVLGLSGGVDSAVAAQLLLKQGFQVTGVYLENGSGGQQDAERTARHLGIDFMARDVRQQLFEKVQQPFARNYLEGKTPNPCILCNPQVKFPALLDAADDIGAEFVATGHYARVALQQGRVQLLRGRNANDQSYMLSGLTRAQLSRCIFPLGELEKSQVRQIAREMGLEVADKPDSMEICFIPSGGHGEFIERFFGSLPAGDIVDTQGKVLGRHKGLHHYTIGQRRGLGVAAGERVFVSRLDTEKNQVVLSRGDDIYKDELFLPRVNWISADPPAEAISCQVRVRHSKNAADAVLQVRDGVAHLRFAQPVRAPVPGQTAVIYDGETVLASGLIV